MSAAQTMPHEDRGTYMGSHDTSAIFGLNPFMRPINVYMNKLGMSVHRDDDDLPEQLRMGLKMQPVILDLFAKKMGCKLENEERFIRHQELTWFGGTPDATIVGDKAGVDAKNVRWNRGDWGDEGSSDVPEYVAMQCHHFMTLLGYERWYVATLFGGCEFKIYEVIRDDEISDMIIKADAEFWREHIEKEIPPEIDGSESWQKYIARKFPKDNGGVRLATIDELLLLDRYRRQKALLDRREARVEQLKNELRKSIGEYAGITCELGRVSHKTQRRTTLDGKRLKEDMPDIARKYEKVSDPFRVLKITLKEDE